MKYELTDQQKKKKDIMKDLEFLINNEYSEFKIRKLIFEDEVFIDLIRNHKKIYRLTLKLRNNFCWKWKKK